MELTVGQRIDVFEVKGNPYGMVFGKPVFKNGSHYAEVAGNNYHGNAYGT